MNCLSSAPVQRTRPPACAGGLVLHSAKNAKTGSAVERRRKRRCLSYENSQTFAVVRRWLVVCPPHWLLPRISGGQCFFKGAAASVFCRGVRFSLPALASCGRIFRSSLTALLLYRIKMEFLCEVFEQIENKKISRSAQGPEKTFLLFVPELAERCPDAQDAQRFCRDRAQTTSI